MIPRRFYLFALAAGLLLAPAARAADTNTTAGECSPIITNNQAAVTIECKGMSQELQKQLIDILNSILQKQLDPGAVMEKLDEISSGMGELKRKSVDAARGVVSVYDFTGVQRIQTPGRIQAVVGEQFAAFQKITEFEKAQNWKNMLEVCEQQIVAAPRWLTAYLCAGEAYAELGDRSNALKRLQFVVENAGNDPAYRQAAIMIERLKTGP